MSVIYGHFVVFIWFAAAILHGIGIIAAGHAVMNVRTSQAAVAWAIALVTFPYITLPLYAVLGRDRFQGYVDALHDENIPIRCIAQEVANAHSPEIVVPFGGSEASLEALQLLAKMPFTRHNEAKLLVNGRATFDAIFDAIERARDYILLQFFIVHDDRLGRELKERLIQKATEGVKVYFLYDEVGSHSLPSSYVDELNAAGGSMKPFRTTRGRANRFQVNFRNHRKIVVVDGLEAYVGGHNVGDEYLGGDPKLSPWRDTHVKVSGPSVLGIQLSFLDDWYWASLDVPELNWIPDIAEEGGKRVLVLGSGPADDMETCSLFFVQVINMARNRVWITSPYFVPDEAVLSALRLAALRGVDVRIMIPEKVDHMMAYLAAFSFLEETVCDCLKIYRYQDGFLHQKVLLVDDELAAVGTANLDNRSLRLNFEITLVFADTDFASEVADMLEDDFSHCRKADLSEYEQRPLWFRVAVRVARLFSPIL